MHQVTQPVTGENGPILKQQPGSSAGDISNTANSHHKGSNGVVMVNGDNDAHLMRSDSSYHEGNGTSLRLNGGPPFEEDLPQEMTAMIPLKSIVEKLVHHCQANLQTLTDTYVCTCMPF